MSKYDYLIDKINEASFSETPFRHLHIASFFSGDHFQELVRAPEIDLQEATDDEDLFAKLFDAGFKIVEFPGCITNKKTYLKWHSNKGQHRSIHSACEGFGVTLRLFDANTPAIVELQEFLASKKFNLALAEKFGVEYQNTQRDNGIQKYLDGYEISPHPDIRRKALTFMVNINPHDSSEERVHHTHYLQFRKDREEIYDFWEKNEDVERCWVPWDWCETTKIQSENNSIVIFSPNNRTLHGVKAEYDHLPGQRTQLYGNLWYPENPRLKKREWEFFEGRDTPVSARNAIKSILPLAVTNSLREAKRRLQGSGVGRRDF